MRRALMAIFCTWPLLAGAQTSEPARKPAAEKAPAKSDEKKAKPRPRVTLKRNGGGVGDDAAGGGAASGAASKGGTPGTPSGSFTRP
jgi:hypothetical protein